MSKALTRAEYKAALEEHDRELTCHLDAVDVKALPTSAQFKEWYELARPVIAVLGAIPLIPSKGRLIINGFLAAADSFFTAVV